MLHILTLHWNKKEAIQKLKNTLIPCLSNVEWQWHIKDNASNDGSDIMFKTWKEPNIKIYYYPDNTLNFSEGVNWTFNQAKPKDEDMLLLLNNDVYFGDTLSIDKMIKILSNPDVGIVGARLLYPNSNLLQHAGVVINKNIGTPCHYRHKQQDDKLSQLNREFQAVTGAVMLTKCELFRKNNGLDNKFIWAFDDINYCMDIRYNHGKKIIYCGETDIYHEESASLKINPINRIFLNQNIKYFFQKWRNKYTIDQGLYEQDPGHMLYP